MPGSKYAHEERPPDYRHEPHAGNVGDVWKHCVLAAWLNELLRDEIPLTCIDCHAGCGAYELGPTGEWREGAGRLVKLETAGQPEALRGYIELVKKLGFDGEVRRRYPGSPLLIAARLRAADRLRCFEIDPAACTVLKGNLARDTRAEVQNNDGAAYLAGEFQQAAKNERRLVLIDPPWNKKADWHEVPRVLLGAWRSAPQAAFMLWYPIKSYTRVAAMQQELGGAGLPFVCLDLITAPLEYRRRRLNGSGVLLVNASGDLISAVSAAGGVIGRRCAVFAGEWQFRCTSRSGVRPPAAFPPS